jgi:hypothetical protein
MGTNNQSDAIILLIYVAYRKGDFKDLIPDKKIIQPAVSGWDADRREGKVWRWKMVLLQGKSVPPGKVEHAICSNNHKDTI